MSETQIPSWMLMATLVRLFMKRLTFGRGSVFASVRELQYAAGYVFRVRDTEQNGVWDATATKYERVPPD